MGDTVRAALEASRTLQPQAIATVATRPAQELTVTVRRAQLQSIVDACTRAGLAARQAQLLSESAARAFGSEAAALDSCRLTADHDSNSIAASWDEQNQLTGNSCH